MADVSRQEKLAAARKKLKQFQQQKTTGKTPSNSPAPSKSRNSTPANKPKKNKSSSSKKEKASTENTSVSQQPTEPRTNSTTTNTTESIEIPNTSNNDTVSDNSSTTSSNTASERPMSSSESLRQMSRQINGLVSEASFLNSTGEQVTEEDSGIRELESRNRELASELEHNMQSNQQLTLQQDELKSQYRKLQEQLEKERMDHQGTMMKEMGSLREQLQVHIQTIGILVSEKSELQTSLNQSQMAYKQKLDEVDNLSSRLQASRHRVAELERDFASVNNTSHQYEKANKELDKSMDQVKIDLYNFRKSNDDLTQQNSELSSQLHAKISEVHSLEHNLQTLQEKVNMSELMIQQLSSSGTDSQQTLQQLQDDKSTLEQKVQQLSSEREQLISQYQQDTSHLQQQIQQLATQVKSLIEERDHLLKQQNRLQNRLTEVEQAIAVETEKAIAAQQEEMARRLEEKESEKEQILQQYRSQTNDNAQLVRLYQEKEEKVEELEGILSRMKEESVDKTQLLDTMQSDKATISRALSQNKELKAQLAELQNGFVKMSNDNMEMMSQYQSEQHISKELATRLSEQEDELREVREQLNSKEKQLEEIKAQNFELNKQLAQQAQLTDHMRHYEAQGQLTETLQRELASAQENTNILSTQNSELRVQLAELQNRLTLQATTNQEGSEGSMDRSDMVDSLSAAIRQLEMERDQLTLQFQEQHEQHRLLLDQMEQIKKEQAQAPAVTPEGNFITKEAYETLQIAMEKLEEKFTRVMRDKADLSDKLQELEHICLQLSGETETIGDYISLYHEQRDRLRQKQKEKEEYVRKLALEKEEMQRRLGQLQGLVMQLLGEKNYLHPYNKQTTQTLTQSFPDTTVPVSAQTLPNSDRNYGFNSESGVDNEYDWPSTDSESTSSTEEIKMRADRIDHSRPAEEYITTSSIPEQLNKDIIAGGDRTAKQIMELLEQMGSPHSIDKKILLDHAFYPCKCCTGELINV
ncbi:golgin subfamily A member 2-like isoform X2 [Glandiceps talaboti]